MALQTAFGVGGISGSEEPESLCSSGCFFENLKDFDRINISIDH